MKNVVIETATLNQHQLLQHSELLNRILNIYVYVYRYLSISKKSVCVYAEYVCYVKETCITYLHFIIYRHLKFTPVFLVNEKNNVHSFVIVYYHFCKLKSSGLIALIH